MEDCCCAALPDSSADQYGIEIFELFRRKYRYFILFVSIIKSS
jgi:hypothetical protein